MAKMNEKTFQVLYEYGKKVYKGELTLNEAAKKAHEERSEVAVSSAKHYITWYSRMRDGSYLTWNTNAQLLLYYVNRIIEEEGIETGKVAISSAQKYAEYAGKDDITAELDKIAETLHIFSEDNEKKFESWLLNNDKNYLKNTVKKYIRALKKVEEWFGFPLSTPIFAINDLEEFKNTEIQIKQLPDFQKINQDHGHGDLSAAMTLYEKFLESNNNHVFGSFDSWTIINETTAVKNCDKSFFEHNGSGIPKRICWFFGADNLQPGEKKEISLTYQGNEYQGRIINDSTDRRRVRIFWNNDLGTKFKEFLLGKDVAATFVKENENKYAVSISAGGEKTMTVKSTIHDISNYITSHGFTYPEGLLENFYLSLRSKPFVILAGTSGTGKTKLVKLFAEAIGATSAEGGGNGRYKLVSVRPDWSDSSDLFGHVNLKGEFIPGAIIDFIDRAVHDTENPYFLCLDEMNLARVEYYLSDFLSLMETRRKYNDEIITDEVALDEAAKEKYEAIYLPENLYIIGTVNMDETTFPFSKKVLDRANTIEFSYVDLVPSFEDIEKSSNATIQKNDFLKPEYVLMKADIPEKYHSDVADICSELQDINRILQTAQEHVGYRVRDEIVFYMINNKTFGLLSYEDAMDNEIMQKILPRIQGSSTSIKELLCELFKKFAGDYTGLNQSNISGQMRAYIDLKDCKYKKSAEKICYMMRRFEEDGFTSYWL